jgi:hypothetical protein
VQPCDVELRQSSVKVRTKHAIGRRWVVAVVLVTVAGCARSGNARGSASDLSGVQSSPDAGGSASGLSIGTITGVVRTYGGPLMPNGQMADNGVPTSGITVTATRNGKSITAMITGPAGSYSLGLPPGTYVVTGCSNATVVVASGQVVHQDLQCDVP